MKKLLLILVIMLVSVGIFAQQNYEFRCGTYWDTTGKGFVGISFNNQYAEYWQNQKIGDDRYYRYDPKDQVLRTYFVSNNELCSVNRVVYDATVDQEKLIFVFGDYSTVYFRKQ